MSKRPCTTAAGTPPTAASTVNKATGIKNTSVSADVNGDLTSRSKVNHGSTHTRSGIPYTVRCR